MVQFVRLVNGEKADSLRELAGMIGVDADGLERTAATYNADVEEAMDSEFGRGSNIYHRYLGDPAKQPNPCMRPVSKPPFYAVELHAGMLGTAAGLYANPDGQVLGRDAQPLGGLYACGNDMNSIMAGSYPGPGIRLGSALVFGYIVGMNLAGGE